MIWPPSGSNSACFQSQTDCCGTGVREYKYTGVDYSPWITYEIGNMRFNSGGCDRAVREGCESTSSYSGCKVLQTAITWDGYPAVLGDSNGWPLVCRRETAAHDIKWWPAHGPVRYGVAYDDQISISIQIFNLMQCFESHHGKRCLKIPADAWLHGATWFCFPGCCNYHWTIPTSSVCFMCFLIPILQKINFLLDEKMVHPQIYMQLLT